MRQGKWSIQSCQHTRERRRLCLLKKKEENAAKQQLYRDHGLQGLCLVSTGV